MFDIAILKFSQKSLINLTDFHKFLTLAPKDDIYTLF